MLIGGDHNVVRRTNMIPFAEILPVLVENLDAAVRPIRDVHPAVRVDVDRVRQVELAGARPLLAPGHQVFSALIELDDARVDVPSLMKNVPSGSQAMSVGRPKCLSSSPCTPFSPSVITNCLPSCVNSKT